MLVGPRAPLCLTYCTSFCDAREICDGAKLEVAFHDNVLERSEVIAHFLSLVTGGKPFEIERRPPWSQTAVWFDVARFVLKYDSSLGRSLLFLWVSRSLYDCRISCLRAFIIGAHLDYPQLCADALRDRDASAQWNHPRPLEGHVALEPGAMRFEIWSMLPAKYSWALGRAWGCRADMRDKAETKDAETKDAWTDNSALFTGGAGRGQSPEIRIPHLKDTGLFRLYTNALHLLLRPEGV